MKKIEMPLKINVDNRPWELYDVHFNDADGKTFSFYIYAVSREHASYIVDEIRQTARLAPGHLV